jgi:flagellar basal-body rod protein FlgB
MGQPFSIVDTTYLEKALDAASLRQQVISSNISNINTPGYQGQQVQFEGHLREAMDNDEAAKAGEADTNSMTVSMDVDDSMGGDGAWTKASLRPTVDTQTGKLNLNNEMANLAKTQIQYNALATKVSGIYGSLKWIVENSGK